MQNHSKAQETKKLVVCPASMMWLMHETGLENQK